jgi:hypothetical protein
MPERPEDGLLVAGHKVALNKQPHQVAVAPKVGEVGLRPAFGGYDDFGFRGFYFLFIVFCLLFVVYCLWFIVSGFGLRVASSGFVICCLLFEV